MNIYEACNWLKDFEMPPKNFLLIDGADPKKELQYKALLTLISAAKNGELVSRDVLEHVREKREREADEKLVKIRKQICDEFCKYTDNRKHGRINQETLDETCEYDCPLSKL